MSQLSHVFLKVAALVWPVCPFAFHLPNLAVEEMAQRLAKKAKEGKAPKKRAASELLL